jgi:SAM-dependent methyltransferase
VQRARARVLGERLAARALSEALWADAPEDPEPWAWRRRRALLLAEARPGERVLDLGCGAGRFVAALRDAGADPVGIEVAEAALERARRVAPDADLRLAEPDGALPLEHGSIDLVWCSEVLQHVPDTSHLLLEVRRVLRRGGRLLFTVPYHGRAHGAVVALTRFDAHFDPLGHRVRFYTRRSLKTTLHRSGFEDVRASGRIPGRGLIARARRP